MRRFIVIWAGQLVTLVANSVLRFGFVVHAWASGQQASRVVLLSLCAMLPQVFLSPTAGAVVDRVGRRIVLLLTNVTGLAVVSGLGTAYLLGHLGLGVIYAAVTVMGACAAFQFPALASAVPLLVPRPHLQRANGLLSSARSAADVCGPAIAAVLLAAQGIGALLAASAVGYVVAVLTIAVIRIAEQPSTGTPRRRLAAESLEGLRYLLAQPSLRGLTGIVFAVNLVMVFGFAVVQPMVLARTGDNTAALASVVTAMGLGGVTGGLLLGAWGGPKSRIRGMLYGVVGMCLTAQILFASVRGVVAWSVTIFAGALLLPIVNGTMHAIFQTKVPTQRQGRVFGAVMFVSLFATPLALVAAALLADHVFEPQAAADSGLVAALAPVVGTGQGTGMATMLLLAGLGGAAVAVWGMTYRPVRDIDVLLPDLEPTPAEPEGPVSEEPVSEEPVSEEPVSKQPEPAATTPANPER